MTKHFKTSVVVLGQRQVDDFHALCFLLGRRPHQLAADMVLAGIEAYRNDPKVAASVARLVEAQQANRDEEAGRPQPLDLNSGD
jgi:hypothetical protein